MSTEHRPIMIVGEAWGEQEERTGQAFEGPSGSLLRGLLRQAGIDINECYLTNVFNLRPSSNQIDKLCGPAKESVKGYRPLKPGKYVLAKYQSELDRLFSEIERVQPNLIIACGNTPLWALCKKVGIKKYRGAPSLTHPDVCGGKYKVIPTWHPAAIMRQWELRVVTLADLTKAKRESSFPELHRPSHKIYLEPSLEDIEAFYQQYLLKEPFLSVDIETKEKTITEIGFATADGSRCIVIPFWSRENADGNYWPTLNDEKKAWQWVRYICENHYLVGQNFSYDMNYLWRTVGIPCPHFVGDTMVLHHSLQPELEKGLGFLGSVYTNEPSWKFMRTDHSTLKQGDE